MFPLGFLFGLGFDTATEPRAERFAIRRQFSGAEAVDTHHVASCMPGRSKRPPALHRLTRGAWFTLILALWRPR